MVVYLYDSQINEIFPQDRTLFLNQDPSLFRLEVQGTQSVASKVLELKDHLNIIRANSSNYKIQRMVIKSHGHSGSIFIGDTITSDNVNAVMSPLNGYFELESQIILDGCGIGGSSLSDRSGEPIYHSFTEMYAAFGDDSASYTMNLAPMGSGIDSDILRLGNYNILPQETAIQRSKIQGLRLLYGFLQASGAKRIFAAVTRQLIDQSETETLPSGESVIIDMNQYHAQAPQAGHFDAYDQNVNFEGDFVEMLNSGDFRRIHGGSYNSIIRNFIQQQQPSQASSRTSSSPQLNDLSDL